MLPASDDLVANHREGPDGTNRRPLRRQPAESAAGPRAPGRASRVLLLDEPTRGVDVATKFEIYEWINRLTLEGKARAAGDQRAARVARAQRSRARPPRRSDRIRAGAIGSSTRSGSSAAWWDTMNPHEHAIQATDQETISGAMNGPRLRRPDDARGAGRARGRFHASPLPSSCRPATCRC